MDDRELIALAAKAAKIEIHESDDGTMQKRPVWCTTNYVIGQPYGESRYDPINYDIHAFQLAVILGMEVYVDNHPEGCACTEVKSVTHGQISPFIVNHDKDQFAATRRAIVLAAASIGENM